MRILIVGAGLLLAATAAPALANGGGGRGGGSAGPFHGFGDPGWMTGLARATYGGDWRSHFRPGKHHGWFRGRHWGWFKPHNPHWPHEPPASP
jgi:hypothetical protein